MISLVNISFHDLYHEEQSVKLGYEELVLTKSKAFVYHYQSIWIFFYVKPFKYSICNERKRKDSKFRLCPDSVEAKKTVTIHEKFELLVHTVQV